jgi:hypothetical protein
MFEHVGDFRIFGLLYVKVVQVLFVTIIGLFLVGFFFVIFAGLVYVERSYYFLQLVVLMSIIFVSSEVLMGARAFW